MDSPITAYGRRIAPEPVTGDMNVTADDVIEHRLVQAMENYTRLADYMRSPVGRARGNGEVARSVENKLATYALSWLLPVIEADLLMQVQDLMPEIADDVAREHLTRSTTGDFYPTELWAWLVDRGINADQLIEEARATIAREIE